MRDPSFLTNPDIPPWPPGSARTVGLDDEGLVVGAGTVLARMAKDGRLSLDTQDRERLLTLLSVVARRAVPADTLHHIEAAAGHWRGGDKALANLRLVFSGLPRPASPSPPMLGASASRRDAAAHLDAELGLDPASLHLGKSNFNPYQPRVPAGSGRQSGQWEAIWNRIMSWLDEPVPEYDQDDGTEVGTRTRGRAIATNPLTIIGVGAAGLVGAEAVIGAMGAAAVEAPVTIADVADALPEGMSPTMMGRIAGFTQGLKSSGEASIEATEEVISKLKSAGVSSKAISLAQRFYAGAAKDNPGNLSAIQRAALLKNILKGYK